MAVVSKCPELSPKRPVLFVKRRDVFHPDGLLTRSLARRAFMQFSQDARLLSTVCTKADPTATLADAARLLSAIFFVNVWPEDADPAVPRFPTWLYLNPRATHRYSLGGSFQSINIHGTSVDDFSNDDY
jgi:hypothetical protein